MRYPILKSVALCLFFTHFFATPIYAQNQPVQEIRNFEFPTEIPLILDPKTGKTTSYQGTAAKTTDRFESGSATITTEGPIKYTITPALTIGNSETKTWNGKVEVDMSQVRVGSWWTHKGKMTAAYVANFRRDGVPVRQTGNIVVKFFIYELEANLKPFDKLAENNDTMYMFKNSRVPAWVNFWPGTTVSSINFSTSNNLVTLGEPSGGMSVGNGYIPVNSGNTTGISSAMLQVTAQGLTVNAVMPIRIIDDPMISGPDLVMIPQRGTQIIQVSGVPRSGTYRWGAAAGLQVVWDSGSRVMIRNNTADEANVTVTYSVGGKNVSKIVKVVTDPKVVIFPTAMTLKIGKTGYVRASAVGFRTPTFNVQIRQGANPFVIVTGNTWDVGAVSMGTGKVEAIQRRPTVNTTDVEARYFTNGENPISALCRVTIVDGLTLRADPARVGMVNNVGSPRVIVRLIPNQARPRGTYTITNNVDFVNVQLDAAGDRLIITPLATPREGLGVIKVKYEAQYNGVADMDEIEIPVRASTMRFNTINFTYAQIVPGEVLRTDRSYDYTISAFDGFGNNIAGDVKWKIAGQVDKSVRNGTFVDFNIAGSFNSTFTRTWDVWRRGGYISAPRDTRMDIRYWVYPDAAGMTNNKRNVLTNTIFKP